MMHLDLKYTLADNDLRKVSRMCGAAGVDVRYPLLDEALVEFSGDLTASLKVKGFKLRHFFKQSLTGFLPPETITKTKHGFGLPFGLWLKERAPCGARQRKPARLWASRGILSPRYIEELGRQHATDHAPILEP
jgi:asparagine synthase (glutamine-hydrolysing)